MVNDSRFDAKSVFWRLVLRREENTRPFHSGFLAKTARKTFAQEANSFVLVAAAKEQPAIFCSEVPDG
jgi:hypothetical protein